MKNGKYFDGNYFSYTCKKLLPYGIAMTVLLMIINFFMILSIESYSYLGNLNIYEASLFDIMFPSLVLMYILPAFFAIPLFTSCHKKNAADFFGAVPLKRSAMFTTNLVIAAVYFFAVLAVNTVLIFVMLKADPEHDIFISANTLVSFFITMFLGYMEMYAIAAVAAVLTGTAISQFVLTYVFTVMPVLLVSTLKMPIYENAATYISRGVNGTTMTGMPVIVKQGLPNILALPEIALFSSSAGNEACSLSDFFGIKGYIVNIVFIIALFMIGLLLFRKYKYENAENPFTSARSRRLYRYLTCISILTLMFFLFLYDSDTFYEEIMFWIVLAFVFICYSILEVILNKGFAGFFKAASVFAVCTVISLCVAVGLYCIEGNITTTVSLTENKENVSEVVFFIPQAGESPMNTEDRSPRDDYVRISFKDRDIIDAFINDESMNGERMYLYASVYYNGFEYFSETSFSTDLMKMICSRIEHDPDLMAKIFRYDHADYFMADFIIADGKDRPSCKLYRRIENSDLLTQFISEKDTQIRKSSLYEVLFESYSETSCGYINSSSFDDRYFDYLSEVYSNDIHTLPGEMCCYIYICRYHDGDFFTSAYSIDSSYEGFEKIIGDASVKEDYISKYTTTELIGTTGLSGGYMYDLAGKTRRLNKNINEEFIETLRTASDPSKISENKVIVRLDNSIAFLDYETQIVPLMRKLVEKELDTVDLDSDPYIFIRYAANGYETESAERAVHLSDIKGIDIQALKDYLKTGKDHIIGLMTTSYTANDLPEDIVILSIYRDYSGKTTDIYLDRDCPALYPLYEKIDSDQEMLKNADRIYVAYEPVPEECYGYVLENIKYASFNDYIFENANPDSYDVMYIDTYYPYRDSIEVYTGSDENGEPTQIYSFNCMITEKLVRLLNLGYSGDYYYSDVPDKVVYYSR